MNKLKVLFLIFLIINLSLVQSSKISPQKKILFKKTKKNQKKKTIFFKQNFLEKKKKRPERPLSVQPELYCNACQAIVREALGVLRHRTSESEVKIFSIKLNKFFFFVGIFF